ncbi:protein phosphatase CheZ [Pseudomonas schmalbachii]|uniref:Protein phosphatase CheZ n=1 Tax=Pseudomonas schmalbachii TaxID=2816993 RepID=A0ABS3TQ11_9PSED|nr:protein phosphatase CheZ [Pseudomonas schmalbachii]MBO3275752.1 protein phosphatase CheZ [Pseudomonas schmalbachii]
MELVKETVGDFESTLKQRAHELVASLERGEFTDAVQLIGELNQVRDRGLYQEVGKLTRELHNAIVNFQIDPRSPIAQEVSEIADATDRLSYVVRMTEDAANRTMDLVEQSTPLLGELGNEAGALYDEWQRLRRRELGAEDFRLLAARMERFLLRSVEDNRMLSSNLNDILLAQDFQDLTGQVIKRVTRLVTDVERDLVKLVCMAGQVDRYVGIEHDHESMRDEAARKRSSQGEGPQVAADKREDVVSSQDDVDDLLSSLGF